jgi:hypothetical protein
MKSTLTNKSTIHQGIDNFITNWKSKASALVELKAKSNARKNLPKPNNDILKRYVGFLEEAVQDCIRNIDRLLQVRPILYEVTRCRAQRDKVVFEANNQIDELEIKLISYDTTDAQPINRLIFYRSIGLFIIICLLGIAEGILSYRAFKYVIGNSLTSVIVSGVFAFVWVLMAEKIDDLLEKSSGNRKRILWLVIGVVGTIIFYIVSHLRCLEKASSKAIINHESLPTFFEVNKIEVLLLTCLGWLFFAAGLWIAQKTPSLQETKQMFIDRSYQRNIRNIKAKIIQLQNLIKTENEKVDQTEREAISLLNIRKQAITEVEGFVYLLIEEFKELNYQNRPDGEYPTCFNEKLTFELDTKIADLREDIENQMQNSTI